MFLRLGLHPLNGHLLTGSSVAMPRKADVRLRTARRLTQLFECCSEVLTGLGEWVYADNTPRRQCDFTFTVRLDEAYISQNRG